METKNKVFITLVILIVVALAFITFSKFITKTTGYGVNQDSVLNTAQCLQGKDAIFYCSLSSSECNAQKEEFGYSFKFIKSIECTQERDACASLESIPAWKINGKLYYGFFSVDEIRELTGC